MANPNLLDDEAPAVAAPPATVPSKAKNDPNLLDTPTQTEVIDAGEIDSSPISQKLPTSSSISKMPVLQSVAQMQKNIMNLSHMIASDIPASNMKFGPNDEKSVEKIDGSDSFFNFLVNSYMNKAKSVGKQLVNTDIKQPVRMDTAKMNDNFRGVLNTLRQLGSAGSEQKPDGVWGNRTTNAIKQVYALAHSIFEVSKDMGFNFEGFSDKDLAILLENNKEDGKTYSSQAENTMAANVANGIEKFSKFYTDFKDKVIGSAKSFINQDSALVRFRNPTEPKLSKEQQDALNAHKNTSVFSTLNGSRVTITPANLTDMAAFKKYLAAQGDVLGIPKEELNSALVTKDGPIKFIEEILKGLKDAT